MADFSTPLQAMFAQVIENGRRSAGPVTRALVLRLGGEPIGRQVFPDGLERALYRLPPPEDLSARAAQARAPR